MRRHYFITLFDAIIAAIRAAAFLSDDTPAFDAIIFQRLLMPLMPLIFRLPPAWATPGAADLLLLLPLIRFRLPPDC
jgi:hypothetical protein